MMLIDIYSPLISPDNLFSKFSPQPNFEIQHFLGFWIWVFLIPYIVLFSIKNTEHYLKVDALTRVAICASGAFAFWNPLAGTYDRVFFFLVLFWTLFALWGLYWKREVREIMESGYYPLTVDPKGKLGFPTESLHMNVQIIGGTGTGKTHYVIKPLIEQTIHQGLGCFIYDMKGNMAQDVAFYIKNAKSRGNDLFLFDIGDPKTSHTYNPLFGSNPDAIANRVFTALYYDTKNSEPYYVDLAKAFLHNLISLLMQRIETITFADLLHATEEAETFRTIQWFCAMYPDLPQSQYFRNQWLEKSGKQRQQELSGLINKLQRFCNCIWAPLLNTRKPDITMKRVLEENRVFLFSPDAARYPEDAKPLAILAMMDLAEQTADRQRNKPKRPFRVFLDEFYNLAYPRFIDFINKCREAEVNLFLAHQSLGDLRGVSQEFQEQVMNTARNKILLGVDDPETAEHFARQFGTEEDKNYQVESYDSTGALAGYSKPKVEKFRFHPNQIKELRTGEAIVKIVSKNKPYVFQTALKPATTAPRGFNWSYVLGYRATSIWDKKKEPTLAEIMKNHDELNPKRGKDNNNLMGGKDAA